LRFLLQRGSLGDRVGMPLEEGGRMLLLLQGKALQFVGDIR
jgi:hypothetical protein